VSILCLVPSQNARALTDLIDTTMEVGELNVFRGYLGGSTGSMGQTYFTYKGTQYTITRLAEWRGVAGQS